MFSSAAVILSSMQECASRRLTGSTKRDISGVRSSTTNPCGPLMADISVASACSTTRCPGSRLHLRPHTPRRRAPIVRRSRLRRQPESRNGSRPWLLGGGIPGPSLDVVSARFFWISYTYPKRSGNLARSAIVQKRSITDRAPRLNFFFAEGARQRNVAMHYVENTRLL